MDKNIQTRRRRLRHRSLSVLQTEDGRGRLPSIEEGNKVRRHELPLSTYRLIDYSMERVAYKGQKLKYLSSKIDFFNSSNQHRLDISKNNILKYSGAQSLQPKPKPLTVKRRHNLTPALHCLVQQFIKNREEKEELDDKLLPLNNRKKFMFIE